MHNTYQVEIGRFITLSFKERGHAENFCRAYNNTLHDFHRAYRTEGHFPEPQMPGYNNYYVRGAMFVPKVYMFCRKNNIPTETFFSDYAKASGWSLNPVQISSES